MARDRRIELRVGLFVMAALLIGGALVFTIGNQRSMFRSKTPYKAVFESVGGLRPGGPVRMAGVDVGTVTSVKLNAEDGKIHVELGIVAEATELIRSDTVATIGSKGLLGDMLVDLTVGEQEALPPNGEIQTKTPEDIFAQAGQLAEKAGSIADNVDNATRAIGTEEFGEDIRQTMANLKEVTALFSREDGAMHRLLSDPQTSKNVNDALKNASAMSLEISRTARSARMIMEEIRHGNGGAHALIYGPDSGRLVASGADALGELATTLAAIRSSNGLAHEVFYGEDSGAIVSNLESATADIAAITHLVREGDGTLGALISDPSVYEDVKRLVGNLERNEILRALVRYSITADESRQPTEVEAPTSATTAAE